MFKWNLPVKSDEQWHITSIMSRIAAPSRQGELAHLLAVLP